jgi:hypothetical protein
MLTHCTSTVLLPALEGFSANWSPILVAPWRCLRAKTAIDLALQQVTAPSGCSAVVAALLQASSSLLQRMQRGSQLTPYRSRAGTQPHALLPQAQQQQQLQPQQQRRTRPTRHHQQQQQQQHYSEDDSSLFDEEYVEQDSAAVPPAGKGFSAQVTVEYLQQFFHLPIEEAARRCGVSTTIVKVSQNILSASQTDCALSLFSVSAVLHMLLFQDCCLLHCVAHHLRSYVQEA